MKKLITLCICLFNLATLHAQTQPNPVTWFASYKSISATEGEIVISATIEKNWHTYSQRPTDAGPVSTIITFAPSKNYELIGKTEETDAHEEFDKAFDAKIYVFTEKAGFRQKVKLNSKPGFVIPFKVEFICCNDMMCQPPKIVNLTVKTP